MIQTLSLVHSIAFGQMAHVLFVALILVAGVSYYIGKRRVGKRNMLQTYMELADASSQVMYLTDPLGNCTAVNQRWLEVTGQSYQSALGSGFRAAIHPDDRGGEQHAWERARRSERTHEHQVRFRLPDGSTRWHLIRSVPVRQPRGAVIGWMGTAVNIDAQVRAADSMRFLADASEAISTSLNAGDNLTTLARITIGSFADHAEVWMRMQDDSIRIVSLAHCNPVKHMLLEREARITPTMQPSQVVKRVLDGQGPFLASDIMEIDAVERAHWEKVDAHSVIVVPLLDAGGHILGALVLTRNADSNFFDDQDLSLSTALARRAGSAVSNARLFEASRKLAKTLQSAFLPPFLPVMEGLAFEAVYRPAAHDAQVGGDWYDVFPLHDGRLALSIGDIMGHGLAAATAMVRIRETIRAAAASLDADPSAVLAFANRAMCSSEGHGLATAVFAVYDTRTSRFDYAVAGHPRPLIVRGQRCIELNRSAGMVLGIDPEARCTVGSTTLGVGDRIVLYTDGLVEYGKNVSDGERRLRNAMCANESAETVVDLLLSDQQSDDVALLMMSVSSAALGEDGSSGWRFHSDEAASATSARASFANYLLRRGVEEHVISIAELVFGELVSNVVRHAPGPIDIVVRFDDEIPILTVGDRGEGLLHHPGRARLPDDAFSENGRGLFLIERLASTPRIHLRRGGGTEITVPLHCTTSDLFSLA